LPQFEETQDDIYQVDTGGHDWVDEVEGSEGENSEVPEIDARLSEETVGSLNQAASQVNP
jgi:hypothetical protein